MQKAVEFATLEWVDWFNNRRLLEPIGNVPPAEAEVRTMPKPTSTSWQRDSNQTASGKPGAVQPGAETEFEVHLGCSKRWQFRFKDLFDGER